MSVSLPVNLLAVRECVEFTADPLVFGNGSAPIHVGPPAHCLSLWAVPGHGVVLACEDWTADPVEGLADWRASGVDGAVDRLLAPFGFTTDTRLRDVFPDAHAVLPNVRLADLVAATGHERASAGLVVEVRGDGGDRVRQGVGGTEPMSPGGGGSAWPSPNGPRGRAPSSPYGRTRARSCSTSRRSPQITITPCSG